MLKIKEWLLNKKQRQFAIIHELNGLITSVVRLKDGQEATFQTMVTYNGNAFIIIQFYSDLIRIKIQTLPEYGLEFYFENGVTKTRVVNKTIESVELDVPINNVEIFDNRQNTGLVG
jgi:hypothetical protein